MINPKLQRVVALIGIALAAVVTVSQPTVASAADGSSDSAPLSFCVGEFESDKRLGPDQLPASQDEPVGPLLNGYHRTGGLPSVDFLKKYWEGPADTGGWKYPPNDGFAVINGVVDVEPTVLDRGKRLDRFGSESGRYLAPAGDAYAKRAIPPQSLNTRDSDSPCDYHEYEVVEPFQAWQGSVAPWFEQPGGGEQIKLDPALLDPGTGGRLSVKWLIENGYLARVADTDWSRKG
ncbi:TNT domain-containing protein [Streptomyces vinaceus]